MKSCFFFLVTVFSTLLMVQPSFAQGTVMSWNVNGTKREAIVIAPAPANNNAVKHPLVFGFHGHGGNMNGASQLMHFQNLWPGAVIVYPQGLDSPGPIDPHAHTTGWQFEANQTSGNVGNRDLDFFDAMLTTVKQKYSIDDKRIYTSGFSSGGVFSYLLWAERPNVIAAVGEVAGRLWDSEHLSQPRALLAIAGKADTTDPFAEQLQSIETARQTNSATGQSQQCGPVCTFYPSTTQTPVKTFIHNGGHVYPPLASAEIIKFFKAHMQI